jgi:ethanolamine utilization protein EutN
MLMIQPLTDEMKPSGDAIAAIDTVQAGPNDMVYWITGREAALALPEPFAPVDATIVGIVDSVDIDDKGVVNKEKIFNK